jgi:hypothetical protein
LNSSSACAALGTTHSQLRSPSRATPTVAARSVGDRADELEREEHEGELDPIWQAVMTDALGLEDGGGAVDPVFQFAVGNALSGVDNCFPLRVRCNTRP